MSGFPREAKRTEFKSKVFPFRPNVVGGRSFLEGRGHAQVHVSPQQVFEVALQVNKLQHVGRQLGFKRVGSNIRERIGSIIDTMLGEGMLTRENGQLAVPESGPSE